MDPWMQQMPYYGAPPGANMMQPMPYSLGGSNWWQQHPQARPQQPFPQMSPQQRPQQQQQRGSQNLSALGLRMMSGQAAGNAGPGGVPYGMGASTLNPQWPWDKPGYQAPDYSWLWGGMGAGPGPSNG